MKELRPIIFTKETARKILREKITARATDAAKDLGIYTCDEKVWWWLGEFSADRDACAVNFDGYMPWSHPLRRYVGIRPAFLYSSIEEYLPQRS